MKTILTKIEFHYTYLIIALGFILCGCFINIIIFTSLILIHELGHIIFMKKYNFNIEKVIIYPYGGLIKGNNKIDNNIDEELLISISGLFFQTIYYTIILILYKYNLVSYEIYGLYTLYHISIAVFNILPIYPLDGFKMFNLYLSKYVSYKRANIYSMIFSIPFLILLIVKGFNNYSYYMILTILVYNLYSYITNINNFFYRFVLEKYLYKNDYQKLKVVTNLTSMHRNRQHIFKINKKLVKERHFLAKIFDNKPTLW